MTIVNQSSVYTLPKTNLFLFYIRLSLYIYMAQVTHDARGNLVGRGGTVTFTGTAHTTNGTMTIYFNGVKHGTRSIDGSGGFTHPFTVPSRKDYGTRATITITDGTNTTNHEMNIPL